MSQITSAIGKSTVKDAAMNDFIAVKQLEQGFDNRIDQIKEKYISQAQSKNNETNKNIVGDLDNELDDIL